MVGLAFLSPSVLAEEVGTQSNNATVEDVGVSSPSVETPTKVESIVSNVISSSTPEVSNSISQPNVIESGLTVEHSVSGLKMMQRVVNLKEKLLKLEQNVPQSLNLQLLILRLHQNQKLNTTILSGILLTSQVM